MLHEGTLHGMQFVAIRQTFDRPDFLAVGLRRKHQTGPHRLAVDDDGAGPANTVLAADMRPGLPAILADRIDQRAARLDLYRMITTVDVQCDGCLEAHVRPSFWRSAARIRCGVAGI